MARRRIFNKIKKTIKAIQVLFGSTPIDFDNNIIYDDKGLNNAEFVPERYVCVNGITYVNSDLSDIDGDFTIVTYVDLPNIGSTFIRLFELIVTSSV